jgi:two-component system sensor histidine kinase/response regulator
MKNNATFALHDKLERLNLLTLVIALILFTLIVISSSVALNLLHVIDESQVKAKMLADNASASLLFKDEEVGQEILQSLKYSKEVTAAVIYDQQGAAFVRYIVNDTAVPDALTQAMVQQNDVSVSVNSIQLIQPIRHQERLLGYLYLHAELSLLYSQMLWQILMTLTAAVLALLIGKLLLIRFIRSVLLPLSNFAKVMKNVSNNDDYAIRMDLGPINELNILAEGFNHMLRQIQERDKRLTGHSSLLEEEVEVRTEQLQIAKEGAEAVSTALSDTNAALLNTQSQLVQSAKLASVGELATGMAHELNQPLGIIAMNASLRLREARKQKFDNMIDGYELVIKQVERATVIINHLRTFGRDSETLDKLPREIPRLIEDSFIMFNEQLRLHDIEVVKKMADNLPPLYCNYIQIEQVLTNLFINAKDALENTQDKKITIGAFTQGKQLVIEVSDNGEGIEATKLNKIFDPFYTSKEPGKGTGLGLSISYGIVQNHDGTIAVQSKVGEGTTFTLTFPMVNIP